MLPAPGQAALSAQEAPAAESAPAPAPEAEPAPAEPAPSAEAPAAQPPVEPTDADGDVPASDPRADVATTRRWWIELRVTAAGVGESAP